VTSGEIAAQAAELPKVLNLWFQGLSDSLARITETRMKPGNS